MSHSYNRLILMFGIKRGNKALLGFHIQSAGSVVQHKHGRILKQRARNGQSLLLTSRKAHAPLAYYRFKAVGQFLNKFIRLRHLSGVHNLLHTGVRLIKRNISGYGLTEQEHILHNRRKAFAHLGQIQQAHISII